MKSLLSLLPRTLAVALLAVLPTAMADKLGTVELQFVTVPTITIDKPMELMTGDGQTIEVDLLSSALSQTYTVSKLDEWVLGHSKTLEDGTTEFVPVCKTASSKGKRQILVISQKDPKQTGDYQLNAFEKLSTGASFLFINASDHVVSGQVGTERFGIDVKQHALLRPQASEVRAGGREFCNVDLHVDKHDKPEPFYTSQWRLNPQASGVIIFHEHGGKLQLHSLREFMPLNELDEPSE